MKGDLSYNIVILVSFLLFLAVSIAYLAFINPGFGGGIFVGFMKAVGSFIGVFSI